VEPTVAMAAATTCDEVHASCRASRVAQTCEVSVRQHPRRPDAAESTASPLGAGHQHAHQLTRAAGQLRQAFPTRVTTAVVQRHSREGVIRAVSLEACPHSLGPCPPRLPRALRHRRKTHPPGCKQGCTQGCHPEIGRTCDALRPSHVLPQPVCVARTQSSRHPGDDETGREGRRRRPAGAGKKGKAHDGASGRSGSSYPRMACPRRPNATVTPKRPRNEWRVPPPALRICVSAWVSAASCSSVCSTGPMGRIQLVTTSVG